MVDTVRSISALLTTLFQDGQLAGSITPNDVRDFVVTMQSRTFGVRVTDPEYGADPTGLTNSTTAFQNAMAAGNPVFVPATQPNGSPAVYTLSNCVVPSGAQLIGFSVAGYAGGGISSDTSMMPTIQALNSAVRIFNVDNKVAIKFEGLRMTGASSTTPNSCDAISAGGKSIVIRDCQAEYCRYGLGGTVAGSVTTYPDSTWELAAYNFNAQSCVTGIRNLVDSWVVGGSFANCNDGIWLDSASAMNFLIGCRIEWNSYSAAIGQTGYGLNIGGGGETNITGCQFDANGNAAIYFNGAAHANISGNYFRGSGVNVTGGTTLIAASCHVLINNSSNLMFSGNTTNVSNLSGPWGPVAAVRYTGTNNAISFVGNDLSGYQGSTAGATKLGPLSSNTLWLTGTAPSGTGANAYIVQRNIGTGTAAQDIDLR